MNAIRSQWQESFGEVSYAQKPENIIVPLDGSDEARAALPVAKFFAQLDGATLHVVNVSESAQGPRRTFEELGVSPEELRGAVLDSVSGDAAERIMELSQNLPTPMIVMCTHAAGGVQPEAFGSVAEAVISSAPAQIVFVAPERGHQNWHIKRVVLAHDGSPTADIATGPAARIAHRAGAEVVALHVAARKASQPEPGSLPAPRYVDQPQHEWPSWANEFLQRMMTLGAPPASVNFRLLVTGGQPGSEIAQFARDHNADLVVLGWHGSWGPEHAGTLKVVVRGSGCPVMLVCVGPVNLP